MIGKIKDPIIGIDIKKDDISVFNHPAQYLMISNVNLLERAINVVTNDLEVRGG